MRLIVDDFHAGALNTALQIVGIGFGAVKCMHISLKLRPHQSDGTGSHHVAAAESLRNQFDDSAAFAFAHGGKPSIGFGLFNVFPRNLLSAKHRLSNTVGALQVLAADRSPHTGKLNFGRVLRFLHSLANRLNSFLYVNDAPFLYARRACIPHADHPHGTRFCARSRDDAKHFIRADVEGGKELAAVILRLHESNGWERKDSKEGYCRTSYDAVSIQRAAAPPSVSCDSLDAASAASSAADAASISSTESLLDDASASAAASAAPSASPSDGRALL